MKKKKACCKTYFEGERSLVAVNQQTDVHYAYVRGKRKKGSVAYDASKRREQPETTKSSFVTDQCANNFQAQKYNMKRKERKWLVNGGRIKIRRPQLNSTHVNVEHTALNRRQGHNNICNRCGLEEIEWVYRFINGRKELCQIVE